MTKPYIYVHGRGRVDLADYERELAARKAERDLADRKAEAAGIGTDAEQKAELERLAPGAGLGTRAIRVDPEVKAALDAGRRPGETNYNPAIERALAEEARLEAEAAGTRTDTELELEHDPYQIETADLEAIVKRLAFAGEPLGHEQIIELAQDIWPHAITGLQLAGVDDRQEARLEARRRTAAAIRTVYFGPV